MKKSTIFALILLVAGLVCCVAAVGMGVGSILLEEAGSWPTVWHEEQAEDKQLQVTTVERLEIDLDSAELTVQQGKTWSLSGGRSTTWRTEGDTLIIEQEDQRNQWRRGSPAPVTLTVPAGDPLHSLDIEVDAGSAEISDIVTISTLTCSVDAGSVTMRNMNTQQLKAEVDVGVIDISACVGGVGVTGAPVQLNCDVGELVLHLTEGSCIGQVSGDVDIGTVDISVDGQQALTHDTGVSRALSGAISGTTGDGLMTIDCDIGNIDISIDTETADVASAA